jgi:hypothetical protein
VAKADDAISVKVAKTKATVIRIKFSQWCKC